MTNSMFKSLIARATDPERSSRGSRASLRSAPALRQGLRIAGAMAAALALAGCAKSAASIDAAYVSPLAYQAHNCAALAGEYATLKRRAAETFAKQDRVSTNDDVAMGIGLVLFWPALFFIDSSDHKHEVARLKGEIAAVEDAANRKGCTVLIDTMTADKKAEAKPAPAEPSPKPPAEETWQD
jgi:hypothetical protein